MNNFLQTKEGMRILKAGSLAVILLAAFLALEVASVAKGLTVPNPVYNTITVTGMGEATSTPDIATFSFAVSADAKEVATAQQTVTTKTNAVFADLKALGIAEKDLKTEDYSVYPKYSYAPVICPTNAPCPPSRSIPDGYTVSQSVQVKVRKIADAGQALAIAGKDGATNISSLSFTMDDPEAPAETARLKAIDNAKLKAQALADRLGVHLGRVTGFEDAGTQGGPYPVYAKSYGMGGADAAVAPTLPTGENKTTANVSVTYEIR